MGPSRRRASSLSAAASMRTKSEGRSGSAGLGGVLDMVADHVDASRARAGIDVTRPDLADVERR